MPLLALVFALAIGTDAHGEDAVADAAPNAEVVRLADLVSDGYAKLDRTTITPIRSGDRLAVFFDLQHPGEGNGTWQYLALFERNAAFPGAEAPASEFRLLAFARIGMRGTRLFDPSTARIRGHEISVRGAAYAPHDAMCCPSLPVRARFVLEEGNIRERQGAGE